MLFFFFNDTATTEIYTLSLHDALPISSSEILSASSRRLSGGFATQLRLMRRRDDCSKGRRKLLTPCSQRGPVRFDDRGRPCSIGISSAPRRHRTSLRDFDQRSRPKGHSLDGTLQPGSGGSTAPPIACAPLGS